MLALNQQDQFGDDDSAAPPAEGGDMMMDRGQRRGQFCKVMYAHKVGELAFVEARLSLTPAQTAAVRALEAGLARGPPTAMKRTAPTAPRARPARVPPSWTA